LLGGTPLGTVGIREAAAGRLFLLKPQASVLTTKPDRRSFSFAKHYEYRILSRVQGIRDEVNAPSKPPVPDRVAAACLRMRVDDAAGTTRANS
jgi:hypothetical protein